MIHEPVTAFVLGFATCSMLCILYEWHQMTKRGKSSDKEYYDHCQECDVS